MCVCECVCVCVCVRKTERVSDIKREREGGTPQTER